MIPIEIDKGYMWLCWLEDYVYRLRSDIAEYGDVSDLESLKISDIVRNIVDEEYSFEGFKQSPEYHEFETGYALYDSDYISEHDNTFCVIEREGATIYFESYAEMLAFVVKYIASQLEEAKSILADEHNKW